MEMEIKIERIKKCGFGRRLSISHARSYPGVHAGWPKNMYPTGSLYRDTGNDIVHVHVHVYSSLV